MNVMEQQIGLLSNKKECRKAQTILEMAKMTHYNAMQFWERPKWVITAPCKF